MSIFLMMIPLATAWFDDLSPVQELKSFDFGAKMMADQKRKDLKAISIKEGPRPNQTVLLGVMWSVSGVVSLLSLALDTNTKDEIRRDYMVKTDDQSAVETRISREVDIAVCKVWDESEKGLKAYALLWLAIVAVPIVLGPGVIFCLEFCFYLSKKCSRSQHPETPSLMKYWVLILFSSVFVFSSLALHLWLAEAMELVFGDMLEIDYFMSLMLKYFAGNSDILIVPCLILFIDPVIGRGLLYICQSRKRNLNRNDSAPINV